MGIFESFTMIGYMAGDILTVTGVLGSLSIFLLALLRRDERQILERAWPWIGAGIGLDASIYLVLLIQGSVTPYSPVLGLHYVSTGVILVASSVLLFTGEMLRRSETWTA